MTPTQAVAPIAEPEFIPGSLPVAGAASGEVYTAPDKEIWGWGLGSVASNALICTFGQAQQIFTLAFKLNPVLVGTALAMPRFVDAIIDPVVGHISDRTHSKWGRRKPYLVGASIVGALLLNLVWWANPVWSASIQFWYLAIIGTLFYTCYGVYTMAWTALGYELTDDYNNRSKVFAISGFYLALVLLANGWVFHAAMSPVFGNQIVGIRCIAGAIGVIIVATALLSAVYCRERFTHTNREHVPMVQAFRTTMTNRPFVVLILVKVCQLLGDRLTGGLLIYIANYYVCGGDLGMATKVTGITATVQTICGFATLPFMKSISSKFGKRQALVAGAGMAFLGSLVLPFVLKPGYPYLMIIPALIVAPMAKIAETLTNAIVPDICDYDELKTGQRREGLFTAVMGFMAKMEISLCGFLASLLLVFSGINVKAAHQTAESLHRLYVLAIGPNIVFTLGAFLIALCFPMTEATLMDVRRQLDERHRAHPELAPDNEVPDPDVEAWVQAQPETGTSERSLPD